MPSARTPRPPARRRRPAARALLVPGLAAALALAAPAAPPRHEEAVSAILRILDSVPLVAIGDIHAVAEQGAFYQRLLRHPHAPGVINDVILELGNELYQGLADRYVAGGRVPPDSLRMIWEDNTQSPLLTCRQACSTASEERVDVTLHADGEFAVTVSGRVGADESGLAEIGLDPFALLSGLTEELKVTEDDGVTTLRLTWPL